MIGSVRPILAHGSGIDDMVMIGIAAVGFLLYSAFTGGRNESGEGSSVPERCAYCGARAAGAGRCPGCGFRFRRGPAVRR